MNKIMQEAFNYAYNETNKTPIFVFYDGITSSKDLLTRNLKLYFVYRNQDDFYLKETRIFADENNVEREVTIKAIKFDDFKTNNKYLTAFLLALKENNFSLVKKTYQEQVEKKLNSLGFKAFITALRDKLYNNTVKLEKMAIFDDLAKEYTLVNVRINEIITSLFENPDLDKALVNAKTLVEDAEKKNKNKLKEEKDKEQTEEDLKKALQDVVKSFYQAIKQIDIKLSEIPEI